MAVSRCRVYKAKWLHFAVDDASSNRCRECLAKIDGWEDLLEEEKREEKVEKWKLRLKWEWKRRLKKMSKK